MVCIVFLGLVGAKCNMHNNMRKNWYGKKERKKIENNEITLLYCNIDDILTNVLMKGLPKLKHVFYCEKYGVSFRKKMIEPQSHM
jgi:hypothetical protein